MSNILLISWFYYPASAVGARRIFNFSKYLEASGHRVTVLTADERCYDDVDAELVSAPTRSEIARTRPRLFVRVPLRKNNETALQGLNMRARFFIWGGISTFLFPDPCAGWIRPATRKAHRLHAGHRFDVVISSGMPWSAFVVGDSVSSRYGIPHLMDYRDPWTAYLGSGRETAFSVRSERLERALIERASGIILNTSYAERLFQQRFGRIVENKIVMVRNGFDPEIYERIRRFRLTDTLQPVSKFRLVHTGLYYASRRLSSMIEAVGQLVATGEVTPANFEVLSYGPLHSDDRRLVQRLKLDALFTERDFVPYEESLQALTRSSMSLLVIGPEHAAMIPAKLYDYMMVEKPIFAVGPAHSEVKEILAKHRYGIYADVASIPDIVEKLRHVMAHRHEYQAGPLKAPDEFNIRNQVLKLAEVVSRS